jgi:D-cysteine desulfhydrase
MSTAPRLHDLFPQLRDSLGYVSLGSPPTPVRPLARLGGGSAEVWLKDDGAYGDGGWGGNKVRKLEWLIPEARRRGRSTILTVGGLGTNWGLACALYGREHGLSTVLALIDQPRDEHVEAQLERLKASGAEIHFTRSKARTVVTVPWLIARHRAWFLPAGGSSPLGALGAVEIALEIAAQVQAGDLPQPSCVVTAVGSGGTAAGLTLGFALAGLPTKVLGVVVNDTLKLDRPTLLRLARRSANLLEKRGADLSPGPDDRTPDLAPERQLSPERLTVIDRTGPGYGHSTPEAEAARRAAASTGLDLDPVYTAKAMAGLMEMNDGRLGDGPVLFLHTDGPRPRP